MTRLDPQVLAHLEWLGFVRPTGLVVSAPALVRAGVILDQRDIEGQRLLRSCVLSPNAGVESTSGSSDNADPLIGDFEHFARTVLGWRFSPKAYAGVRMVPIPPELEVALPDAGDTLRPDFAVRELEPATGASAWQLLVQVVPQDTDFDREAHGGGRFELSAHSRMERLLRHTGVPAGLLVNGRALRLVSAPRAESSGWLDFRAADMVQTAGRPISAALRLLLSEERLLALPRHQRLAALLSESRKFQNEVSEKLAEQVLHALYELLRGFQAAHDASKGALLRQVLTERPDDVYRALLTVILRLVFLLYAEERGLLPSDETFQRYYSLAGLHERLREDAALYPDTMEQRYGAWAQLVALFRMIHDGATAPGMTVPPRQGVLFDPDRFSFLEGRLAHAGNTATEAVFPIEPPLVPDGTVYRALEKLLVLDGERISYRALDVEQIGSVYETMMGFRLETATGRSVAIKAQKKQGAPTALDLDALLTEGRANRTKAIEQLTDRKLSDRVKKAVAEAGTLDALHDALVPVIDATATPDLVPLGAMVLQPSEARRRSGSHYTPRELTEPIVRTTLEPILARLRGSDNCAPRAEAILDLKVCDPAMGSGAFLVEACRYLGDALVDAWRAHGDQPTIPADEDEVVFARRLVAQRCLYGVDRNPMAVDLAKVSLWLVTLAKDHALTFVDHALRHGDSLVGLSRRQIENFHWDTSVTYDSPFRAGLREQAARVSELRRRIREAGEAVSDSDRRALWDKAQTELDTVRLYGDLVVSAFLEDDKPNGRERRRTGYVSSVIARDLSEHSERVRRRREADPPLVPFHWDIEFPEVLGEESKRRGFDALVGNPPFSGAVRVAQVMGERYSEFLRTCWTGTVGQADLVALFFRRGFDLLCHGGCLGFLATNTAAQGDTRESGLSVIRESGGQIYHVVRRIRWPGEASVIVSRVHISKGYMSSTSMLDGKPVERITAFLFDAGTDRNPVPLQDKPCVAGKGVVPWGMGFVFEDGVAGGPSLSEMNDAIAMNPSCSDHIHRFIGGADINALPDLSPDRFIIDLDGMDEQEAQQWPELLALLKRYVKPQREALPNTSSNRRLRERWWQYSQGREIRQSTRNLGRVLVCSQTSKRRAFAFVPGSWIFDQTAIGFACSEFGFFAMMQSRVHEVWSDFFGATLEDRPRYTTSECFEAFPFLSNWESNPLLASAGQSYHDFRASLMARNNEGLTKTYNRFHDPEERGTDLLRLRELHAAIDRAVLDAYGWHEVPTHSEFLLDYEIDEEEWSEKKRKPWRYRWPDDVRDEVLARLLALNAERAEAEARVGAHAGDTKRSLRRTPKRTVDNAHTRDLFS